jgi:mRNA interferase RelE/StbE
LAWKFNFTKVAEKQLDAFDKTEQKNILNFLFNRVALLGDPRSIGEALKGKKYKGLWKYRRGDYRIICRIVDEQISIVVVKIGNRREIYRK